MRRTSEEDEEEKEWGFEQFGKRVRRKKKKVKLISALASPGALKNWLLKLLPTYNSFLGRAQNHNCYRGFKSLIQRYIFHVFLPFVFE